MKDDPHFLVPKFATKRYRIVEALVAAYPDAVPFLTIVKIISPRTRVLPVSPSRLYACALVFLGDLRLELQDHGWMISLREYDANGKPQYRLKPTSKK